MSPTRLVDARVWSVLAFADRQLAEKARAAGCSRGSPRRSSSLPPS